MLRYEEGYAYIDDYKFRRDDKSGYYLSTRKIGNSRIRLHRYMWERTNGAIPEGYEIHHVDEDKNNNELDNLELLKSKAHRIWHGNNRTDEEKANYKRVFDEQVRPKAAEWHRSEEGRAWHREHAKNIYENAGREEFKCTQCGTEFETIKYGRKNMFCSRACAAAERRASGKDDEERTCRVCKEVYITGKYRTAKTCSRACGSELRKETMRKKLSQ